MAVHTCTGSSLISAARQATHCSARRLTVCLTNHSHYMVQSTLTTSYRQQTKMYQPCQFNSSSDCSHITVMDHAPPSSMNKNKAYHAHANYY